MKTKLKILGITLILESTYLGSKECPFIQGNWNNHRITVTNVETQAICAFEYWASISTGKITSRDALLGALECLISDSIYCSQLSYEDYLSEFGLTNGKETLATFKKLQKTAIKLLTCLGLEPKELPEFQQAFFKLTGETYV